MDKINITHLSIQELFDRMWVGLKSQEWKRSASVYYDHINGLKCAVGWIISDDKYTSMMESKAIRDIFIISHTQHRFLLKAMDCHDDSASPEEMEKEFRSLAKDFHLVCENHSMTS